MGGGEGGTGCRWACVAERGLGPGPVLFFLRSLLGGLHRLALVTSKGSDSPEVLHSWQSSQPGSRIHCPHNACVHGSGRGSERPHCALGPWQSQDHLGRSVGPAEGCLSSFWTPAEVGLGATSSLLSPGLRSLEHVWGDCCDSIH